MKSVTGFTALHYAAASGAQGHYDVARTLVERWGADLTPLTRCVGRGGGCSIPPTLLTGIGRPLTVRASSHMRLSHPDC